MHNLQIERVNLRYIFIFIELRPFFYNFMFNKTLNMSINKCKLADLEQNPTRKNTKVFMIKQYPYSTG